MPYTPDGKAVMLDGLRGAAPAANRGIATVSAHTADPGNNGANEVTGGSYARQAVAFNAPAGGIIGQTASDPVIPIPAGVTVTHLGYWSGEGVPKFLGSDPITSETFGSAGNLTVTDSQLDLNL